MILITKLSQGSAHGDAVGHNPYDALDRRGVGPAERPPIRLLDVDQVYP
jgi:hypothetical protein